MSRVLYPVQMPYPEIKFSGLFDPIAFMKDFSDYYKMLKIGGDENDNTYRVENGYESGQKKYEMKLNFNEYWQLFMPTIITYKGKVVKTSAGKKILLGDLYIIFKAHVAADRRPSQWPGPITRKEHIWQEIANIVFLKFFRKDEIEEYRKECKGVLYSLIAHIHRYLNTQKYNLLREVA